MFKNKGINQCLLNNMYYPFLLKSCSAKKNLNCHIYTYVPIHINNLCESYKCMLYVHCAPTEVTPTFKCINIHHNSTKTYVILTTLMTTYLMKNSQVSTKYTDYFLRYESLKSLTWELQIPICECPLVTERVATQLGGPGSQLTPKI